MGVFVCYSVYPAVPYASSQNALNSRYVPCFPHLNSFVYLFIHSRCSIIYRDLKPDNIGFDIRGDVKIFDFGLSRQLPNCGNQQRDGGVGGGSTRTLNDTFQMTGDTGSPRYMAPEVALEQPYNESSDVYSFGILLHQICSLEVPFEGYTMSMFEKKVVRGGYRPKMDPKWPSRIQNLIGKCWTEKLSSRPCMAEVVEILRAELSEHSREAADDMMDASNKTQHSLHAMQRSKAK